ncbi:MAG: pyrroline-5-carboxylate reductase [Clostridia bacterium]|nr:pyrroline-5-carboxylate reductase [Clostridia bacterium]
MVKIAFIGAGNMASAIVNGIVKSKIINSENIYLYDKNPTQYTKFPDGCKSVDSITKACENANYIFLSVKPQNIKEVLAEIKEMSSGNKVFVSICAGITISSIESTLGRVKIVRTMPNTPLLIGHGVTALCRNNEVTDKEFSFVTSLFASSGFTTELNEDKINAITAVTSSSPAYIYYFIKSMLEGASRLGLEDDNLLEMICKTFIGSATMVMKDDRNVDELIRMVKSPNGTTEKALNVLEENNILETICKAMKSCVDRAEELTKLN